jgi:tellurite methyltransferase
MSYDHFYKQIKDAFGPEPEKVLTDHIHLLDRSRTILDVGAGQGRHAIYLARKGFSVDAIEPSGEGIAAITQKMEAENLDIRICQTTIEDFSPGAAAYSGILLFGMLQILSRESITHLIDRIDKWTKRDSFIFITAWSIDDPTYARHKEVRAPVGKHSFQVNNGRDDYQTYLEKDEILDLFMHCNVVYHWEGMGPVHRHGTSPAERHARVVAVFRR